MANHLLVNSGPSEKKAKNFPPRKKRVKIPPVKPAKEENPLLKCDIPTWAYKKGEEPVILRTYEDVFKYANNGWTDKPVK